ncbi:MAG: hypothetical protein GX957_04975 [Clostridiaceae bacterium]|nr:hypothetical protein [Clostridiaceae bacterium]
MTHKKTRFFLFGICVVFLITEIGLRPIFSIKTATVKTEDVGLQDMDNTFTPDTTLFEPSETTGQNTKELPESYIKQLSDNDNELYLSPSTGNIALYNKQNDEIWFSGNDTDINTSSQFKVYYSDRLGVSKTMDSYGYSVSRGEMSYEVNGDTLSVKYILSEDTISVNDVPNIISAKRFEKFYEKFTDVQKADVMPNYILVSINNVEDEQYVKELTEQYPSVANGDIYVLNTSNQRQLQKILEAFQSAGYTSDDLKNDFEENGLEFDSQSVSFTVFLDYTLNNGSLYIDINTEKLIQPDDIAIEKLEIMPWFGCAGTNDSGYFLIPDGSGSLIYFNNLKNTNSDFTLPVYGLDACFYGDENRSVTEKCAFPVFGIKKNDDALIVSMEKGESLAQIQAKVSGASGNYNTAFFVLNLVRSQQESVTIKSTNILKEKKPYSGVFTIRYTPVSGENPGYIQMAKEYRGQLLELGWLKEKEISENYPVLVSLLGAALKEENIFGITYERTVELTSFDDAAKIASELAEKNIGGLRLQYLGWTNKGLRQASPEKLIPNSKLGGKKGLSDLQIHLEKLGVKFYLQNSFFLLGSKGNGFNVRSDGVKKLSGATAFAYFYNYVNGYKRNDFSPYYILSPSALKNTLNGFNKGVENLNISAISSDDIAALIPSDFNNNNTVDRVKAQNLITEALKTLSNIADTALGDPNAYALSYADFVYDVPTFDSGYMITDETVPFYQTVIRGYIDYVSTPINYAANNRVAYLRAIEYGSGLNYLVSYNSTAELKNTEYNIYNRGKYDDWFSTIVNDAQKAAVVFNKLQGKEIVNHSRLSDGVYQTQYEGGTTVIVNYTNEEKTINGVCVPAADFVAIGGVDS